MEDLLKILNDYLIKHKKVAVAFSGGVDSALLATLANKTLGHNAYIYTIVTPYISTSETRDAINFAKEHNFNHSLIHIETPSSIKHNPKDRCYSCKQILFTELNNRAKEQNISAIVEGSNADDRKDYRPGMKALQELKIASPFLELGITKKQIRELSHYLKLTTHDTPSNPCLLTRLPYDCEVTGEVIEQVDKAELFLKEQGFTEVRVRHEGLTARIELPASQQTQLLTPSIASSTSAYFQELGFTFTALDLKAFSSGNMNQTILPEITKNYE